MRFVFIKIFFIAVMLFVGFTSDVQALTLTPTRQTAIIDPGTSQIVKITLKNDESQTVIAKGEVDGFRIDEKTSRAIFGVQDEAREWIQMSPSEVSLSPGETKEISFLIQVPKVVETGVHYLGLFATVAPAEAQVGIASRVGSLLFLYTAGSVTEASHIVDFSSGSNWYKNNMAHIFVQLQNTGNIHVLPEGGIQVKNWRGNSVVSIPLNQENKFLFPNSKMTKDFQIPLTWHDIGKVQVRFQYIYGVGKHIEVKDLEFWYIPTWIIGLCGGIGVLLVSMVIFLLLRLRGNKI